MNSPREATMAAAAASLQAMYPARLVLRGMQDPQTLGDAKLRQGVFALVAERTRDWAGYVGREAESGTLDFALVAYGRVGDSEGTLAVEQLEATLEDELLAWCRATKAAPLDAIYPKEATYSKGLDAPYAWIVLTAEANYV